MISERHKDAGIVLIGPLSAYEIEDYPMSRKLPSSADERLRRRLRDAELTPEQQAAVEARHAERETTRYQEDLARDIAAYRQELLSPSGPASRDVRSSR